MAWLRLGFRPFFLAAGGFASVSVLIWYASYILGRAFPFAGLAPAVWHAHEMLYGYAMAVVAGFLLTAVRNWTGIQTLHGPALLLLFVCWLLARLFLVAGGSALLAVAAACDLLFMGALSTAIGIPIVRARQWGNLAIVGKIVLLLLSNLVFFLGASDVLERGIYWGLYSGLYLIIALIFTLGRRVLPLFIERGVGYPVTLRNSRWVDISSLVLLLAFWVADLAEPDSAPVGVLAGALAALHLWRLQGWYTPGIWKKPLLWVLYLAYASLVAGFALKAAVYPAGLAPSLAVHAFAVGGIGLMTLGMMTRVALGHTGRNVFEPPALLRWLFALLLAALIARVLGPLLLPQQYRLWIGLSQWLWIAAFTGFFALYFPVLTRPRVDGQPG